MYLATRDLVCKSACNSATPPSHKLVLMVLRDPRTSVECYKGK